MYEHFYGTGKEESTEQEAIERNYSILSYIGITFKYLVVKPYRM